MPRKTHAAEGINGEVPLKVFFTQRGGLKGKAKKVR